jgi:hypothetical protein
VKWRCVDFDMRAILVLREPTVKYGGIGCDIHHRSRSLMVYRHRVDGDVQS